MTEFTLRVSGFAGLDIRSILEVSEREFGPRACSRYSDLITAALDAIRTDPQRVGTVHRPEIGDDVYTFHLAHARKSRAKDRVGHPPRHLLVFRIADGQTILVGRILHDAMDLSRHIPQDFAGE